MLTFALSLIILAPASAGPRQDADAILAKGEQLLEEAKKAYEEAKAKNAADGLFAAGFTLEEARIKFLVVQEIGQPDKAKIAAEKLRAIQQLNKLINDAKGAVAKGRPPAEEPEKPIGPRPPDPGPTPFVAPAPARNGEDKVQRMAVPDAAAVKSADELIRELFKEDYARKGIQDSRTLARKLLELATRTSDDPPGLYATYVAAIDAASQGCDPETTTYAIDQLSRFFDVDRLALRGEALATATKVAKSPEDWTGLAEAQMTLAQEYFTEDAYVPAEKAVNAALQNARKANHGVLVQKATVRAKEISEAKAQFAAMKKSLETLAKTSDDPTANQEMGSFLCFVKGSWDLGLRFLALGADPAMKGLAEKEIAMPMKAQEIAELAEAWEALAEKERSPLRKGQMVAHARDLYSSAHPSATGLVKAKIEKKLAQLGGSAPKIVPPKNPPPAAGGPGIDLLALIEPDRDKVNGTWSFEGGVLQSPGDTQLARIQVPYCPPEEYDLVVIVEKQAGVGAFNMGLVAGGSQFVVAVDGFGGNVTGVGLVDGKLAAGNETTKNLKVFVDNKPKTILYRVRKNSLVVTADQKSLIDWKADYKRCSLGQDLRVPATDALFLMSNNTHLAIRSLRLIPVSGRGKLLHADKK